jgi:hypothetical protein
MKTGSRVAPNTQCPIYEEKSVSGILVHDENTNSYKIEN